MLRTAQDSFFEIGGSPHFSSTGSGGIGQNRPPEQMEVFRAVSEALANQDADAFLDQFDPKMPQYEKLRDEIQDLFGHGAGDRIDHRRDHRWMGTSWSWTGC